MRSSPPPTPNGVRKQRVFGSLHSILRPSILTPASAAASSTRLTSTSYLDGLRGFAAFLVYISHHNQWAHASENAIYRFENAYGYEGQYYFAALPGVRLFFSGGHIAVSVFFVISGFVLSSRSLRLIHAGDQLLLADTLASALFRRWVRLFAPLVATTFFYMLSWHVLGLATGFPPHQETLNAEFWNWASEVKNFTYVFRQTSPIVKEEPWLTYNFHLWSIPMEFRGSIVIFTVLLAISKLKRNARLTLLSVLIFYFLYCVDGWWCAMFLSGMLICDLELLAEAGKLPRFFANFAPRKTTTFCTLFVIALYISGVPSFGFDPVILKISPGWHLLSYLRPTSLNDYKWFYLFWAASLLVACVPHLSPLRSFFESRFNQYLGRISYGLYLVHGPILWTLGDRLYMATGWTRENNVDGLQHWFNLLPLSKAGPLGIDMAFLVPQLILLPVTLWTAEVVTKAFDTPSIELARWLYQQGLDSTF